MIVPFATLLLQSLAPPATPRTEAKVVRVWLDATALSRGASVRVYVQAAEDGNLVVLHRRTDGRIEVLFPNNPTADPSVRAGTYEIRGPNDRPGWVVREPDGTGMVLAALSPDPLRVDEFVREAAWNPDALVPTWSGADGEGAMSDVVQRMLGDGYFHYDLVTYTVAPPIYAQQYLPPQDTVPSYASNLSYPPCVDCTFIGVQVLVVEPLSLCDGFWSACLGGRPFAPHRDPCAALSPCGAPPPSALALALGPLPPPELATFAPGRGFATPRGASGASAIAPRPRVPESPVRTRAPSHTRAAALLTSAPRQRSREPGGATGGGGSVGPPSRGAPGAPDATRGPLSHVRFTRLSAPTQESPVVAVAVPSGAARASAQEAVTSGRPGTFAAPGAPGALGRFVPRSGVEASGGQGRQAPQLQPGTGERLGEGRAMRPAGTQPSVPGRTAPTTIASSPGVTGGVAVPPDAWGSAGARVAAARPSIPVRRR